MAFFKQKHISRLRSAVYDRAKRDKPRQMSRVREICAMANNALLHLAT